MKQHWRTWRENLEAWLQSRSLLEQRLLKTLFFIVLLSLVWQLTLAPALQVWRQAATLHAKLDQELAQIEAMAQQAKILRQKPALSEAAAKSWLENSITKLGKAAISMQGNRARVSFTMASAESLALWLSQARQQAQLAPLEANWQRSAVAALGGTPSSAVQADTVLWDGSMIVELPKK